MPADDYQYDVFFSYKRDELIQGWINSSAACVFG